MNIPTYTLTPGLDHYPEHDRFAVYRATHQRLMQEDASYRRRFGSHTASVVCLAMLPAAGFLGGEALSVLWLGLSFPAVVAGIFYLAFRQQRFQNQRIGDALRNQAA